MWQYHNPVKIIFADEYSRQVSNILSGYSNPKILILTSDRFKYTASFKDLEKKIDMYEVYTDIEENPSFTSCQKAIEALKEINPHTIIAVGGGSVIDTAKIVRAAVYKNVTNISRIFDYPKNKISKPILIAIPTTHGTGSEVTMWATVWNKKKSEKISFSEINNYPDYAVYDCALTESLPLYVSISSTMDALSHAMESIWNINANPISTLYALKAIKLIVENRISKNKIILKEQRRDLLLASMYAGLAFSNTKTSISHAISYYLTLNKNIPHGIAASITLPLILEFVNTNQLFDNVIGKLFNDDFIKSLMDIFNSAEISIDLADYGITKYDIKKIYQSLLDNQRAQNFPYLKEFINYWSEIWDLR